MTIAKDGGRKFDMSIELDAPPEDVWRALTDAAELSRWFPLKAEVKPGIGGSIFVSWGADCEGTAEITGWEPGRHFRWVEKIPSKDKSEPVPITIDFHLEGKGGKTVLRLVQSGFGPDASWDDYYDSISRGWKFELRGLRHYLEYHRGEDRHVIWVRRRSDLAADELARRVIGPEGGVLRGEVAGLGEGDRYALAFVGGDGRMEGVVRVNGLPRSFAATVSNLNNSYFRFETENMGGGMEVWLWLSTYGLDAGTRKAVETQWTRALAQALPEPVSAGPGGP